MFSFKLRCCSSGLKSLLHRLVLSAFPFAVWSVSPRSQALLSPALPGVRLGGQKDDAVIRTVLLQYRPLQGAERGSPGCAADLVVCLVYMQCFVSADPMLLIHPPSTAVLSGNHECVFYVS